MGDLNSASIAHYSSESDSFILSTGTLPIFNRTKDPLTEKPVPFGLEGSIVDGFGLGHLAVRPGSNGFR
jgi:hypothetical protein